MRIKDFDTKTLDTILNRMVESVGRSKKEIYRIGEQSRSDHERLKSELSEVEDLTARIIGEGERLEKQVRNARDELSEISMHFKDYSEEEVHKAYERAHQLQMELTLNRQLERQLGERKKDLIRRMHGLLETIDRAEHLVSQISVVMNYLMSDLREMGEIIEDAKLKQEFGIKIIEAQEEERKRLSREIHDGPAQMLANVMMRSDLIERVYREEGQGAAFAEIKSFKQMVRTSLYEVRRIIYDLRPMALDDLGLIPTLKKYLQTIEDYYKTVNISFQPLKEEVRLPANYEVALFRLVQESVQNALKHAEADEIQVKLEITDAAATVLVKDDGKGFDPKIRKYNSFGIMGMKERVDLLGGRFAISTKPGQGAAVIIQIPIPPEK
ncbi:histidine kinase [Neobacillus notoginsengisoli]|uniref:Signal transduction histidine-protein kinase/phosphatase DegS n=1 Tax=Neobacillus notoginsengisoli TaxID=1578198 RepID=A0A417YRF1_9BACI|nr:sensor histidine kinase [Neobacillus notoginsengisoli]RHW37279.1 histidine kinase [Neobacillus notoginsengisoli]